MKKLLKLLMVLILASGFCGQAVSAKPSKLGPQRFKQPWSPKEGTNLTVRISDESPKSGEGVLQILNGDEIVYQLDPGLFPISIFVLDNGNLATQWMTGVGSYDHLFVFSFLNGKVIQSLHTVSNNMYPEFVYQMKGQVRPRTDAPCFQQRIVVPNTDWIVTLDKLGKEQRDLAPKSADIYTWDQKHGKYDVRKNVLWSHRLNDL